METEGRFGERRATGAALQTLRIGPYSELIVNDGGAGRYFEMARMDHMYTSFVKTVTIAATHNSPIAAATATPVLGLFNPPTSSIAGVLTRIAVGTVSGTPAGGQFVLNAIPSVSTQTTATVTGNVFSHLLSDTGASPQGSLMKAYNNVALTGIVPVVSNEIGRAHV